MVEEPRNFLKLRTQPMKISDQDTLVVVGDDEGFNRVFLGENRWWAVRIASNRIEHLKYIAIYRTAPVSAITQYAHVLSVQPWQGSRKSVVNFRGQAIPIGPISHIKGYLCGMQSPRFTCLAKLQSATTLQDVFGGIRHPLHDRRGTDQTQSIS